MWGTRILSGLVLLLLAATLAGGCGSEATPPGEVPLAPTGARLDDHRWLGEPVLVGNLTVWPVHTDAPLDVGESPVVSLAPVTSIVPAPPAQLRTPIDPEGPSVMSSVRMVASRRSMFPIDSIRMSPRASRVPS